jgi:hypothetical protein
MVLTQWRSRSSAIVDRMPGKVPDWKWRADYAQIAYVSCASGLPS